MYFQACFFRIALYFWEFTNIFTYYLFIYHFYYFCPVLLLLISPHFFSYSVRVKSFILILPLFVFFCLLLSFLHPCLLCLSSFPSFLLSFLIFFPNSFHLLFFLVFYVFSPFFSYFLLFFHFLFFFFSAFLPLRGRDRLFSKEKMQSGRINNSNIRTNGSTWWRGCFYKYKISCSHLSIGSCILKIIKIIFNVMSYREKSS